MDFSYIVNATSDVSSKSSIAATLATLMPLGVTFLANGSSAAATSQCCFEGLKGLDWIDKISRFMMAKINARQSIANSNVTKLLCFDQSFSSIFIYKIHQGFNIIC